MKNPKPWVGWAILEETGRFEMATPLGRPYIYRTRRRARRFCLPLQRAVKVTLRASVKR